MPGLVVIGTQWGDEGKGKMVHFLGSRADMVVRFQGGANAGHTVTVDGREFILHLVPSGILHPGVTCVLGVGVVVDPEELVEEIDSLREKGVEVGENFLIDTGAHLVMPYHKEQDIAEEKYRQAEAIGTTGRGIGPAYADRCARGGLTVGELTDQSRFRERLEETLRYKNDLLTKVYGSEPLDADAIADRMRALADRLGPHITDTAALMREGLAADKKILFEGAQGSLLDISFGTYPYVTSSTTTAAGVAQGTGVAPSLIGDTIGITKAYTTRVGAGPFPSEASSETAELLWQRGRETGATTGRVRRCGWLDVVAVRHALALSGIKRIVITKLDVLDVVESIPVCVAYMLDGERIDHFPRSPGAFSRVTPVYEELPGWKAETESARRREDLPARALDYLAWIEELTESEIAAVSVGAGPEATVEFDEVF